MWKSVQALNLELASLRTGSSERKAVVPSCNEAADSWHRSLRRPTKRATTSLRHAVARLHDDLHEPSHRTQEQCSPRC
jgi:hypothetical protein